jgi:hypothetical protein
MPIIYDPIDEMVKAKYYSFDITINEEVHRTWYDPDKHDICFDCGSDDAESLLDFLTDFQKLIDTHAEGSGIDHIELEKFALKHLKKSFKIKKVLDKI